MDLQTSNTQFSLPVMLLTIFSIFQLINQKVLSQLQVFQSLD